MTVISGNVTLYDGEATVYLPLDMFNRLDSVVTVSPYYNDVDKRVPIVAATKPIGGMFKIVEVNHQSCEVAWVVTTID